MNEEDKEEQTDEIEALQSIYPEIVVIENEKHICFELSISMAPAQTIPILLAPRRGQSETKQVTEPHNKTSE